MAARLWHASHPLQLSAVEVVGAFDFGREVFEAFLPLLQVIAVVAAVGVDAAVVHLDDRRADAVEEVAVVGHHEDGHGGAAEGVFEPFYHLEVEVVGGFVEDEQVGL